MTDSLYSRDLDSKRGNLDLYENQLIITIKNKKTKNKAVIPLSHVVDVIVEHNTTIAFVVRGAYSLTRSWSSTYPQMSLQQEMNESFQMVFIDPVRTMDKIRQTIDKIRVAQLYLVENRHNKQQADDEDIRYKAEMNRAEAKYRSDLERYKIAAQNRRSAHNAELAQYNLDVANQQNQYNEKMARYNEEMARYNQKKASNPDSYTSMPTAPSSPHLPKPPPLNLPPAPSRDHVVSPQYRPVNFWNSINKYYEIPIKGNAQTIRVLYSEMPTLEKDYFSIKLKGGILMRDRGRRKENQKLIELLKDRINTPPASYDGLTYKDHHVTIFGQRVDIVAFDPNGATEGAINAEEEAKRIREIRIATMQDDINIIQKNHDVLQKQMDFLRNNDSKQYIQQVKQAYQLEDLANEIKRLEKQKKHIATMPIVIANCVPENIPPEYIWNDAWYDEERDVYFTHSKVVIHNLYGTEKFLQDSLTKKSTDHGALIPAKNIIYAYGYPCVRLTHQHGQSIMPLSTMTEEMLTTELVNASIGSYAAYKSDPDGFEGETEYITDADRIYGGDFTEKEKQIGQENNNPTTHDDVLGVSGECKCKYCLEPTPKPKLGFLYSLLVSNFNRPLKDVLDDEHEEIKPSGEIN